MEEVTAADPDTTHNVEDEGVRASIEHGQGDFEAEAIDVMEESYKEDEDGKESRESRKKRKDREETGESKEERKKRRDEREKRKASEGREKRPHREGRDRKEGKRKKDRKERKDERDGRDRMGRDRVEEMEDRTLLDRKRRDERPGRREKSETDGYKSEPRACDVAVDREPRVSARNSARTNERKNPPPIASDLMCAHIDDDKEEGEILDEDSGPTILPDSEAESGEIQVMDDTADKIADEVTVSVDDSLGKGERIRGESTPAESDRIGMSSSRDGIQKPARSVQGISSSPLQSMLVIAEAYDSGSQASDGMNESSAVVRSESNQKSSKNSENGMNVLELTESERKFGNEKLEPQEKVVAKEQDWELPDEEIIESTGGKGEEIEPGPENTYTRSSYVIEARLGKNSGREELKEQPTIIKPKSRVPGRSPSPKREDSARVGGKEGTNGSQCQSLSSKDIVRDKDLVRGRSCSRDERTERGRSLSIDSRKGADNSRRHARSPDPVRERISNKVQSPYRESSRKRQSVAVDSVESTKQSYSREGGPEHRRSRDKDVLDRRRRSRSRESGRMRISTRDSSLDRRRRSRSRSSHREKRTDDHSAKTDSLERRRRSRSRSARDQRMEDHISNKHSDVLERRHRSRSRESHRDRKVEDRDSIRHMWRGGDDSRHRDSRDNRSSRDVRHYEGSRDGAYRSDRDRGRNYNGLQGRNGPSKDVQGKETRHSTRDAAAVDTAREEENQEEYQERVASQLAAQEEDDAERVKEEKRRRRQAILEKYKNQEGKVPEDEPLANTEDMNSNGIKADLESLENGGVVALFAPSVPDLQVSDGTLSLGKVPTRNGALTLPESEEGGGGLGVGSPKSERSADMFCDDIFGESPAGGRRLGKGDGVAMDTSGLIDNWDDAEGYYCFRIGEILDGRYEVASSHGRGVFSTVVRARDMKAGRGEPEEVAIKIIRNNETMYKAGQQELVILKKLAGADPENKRHCVRLLSSFEYRSHLCLVFESLHMNLREILKKFGRNIGINLNAVRVYAKQLFISLKHLRNCGVLHCDIKPDNMLVNESKNVLKLCDFGSAMFAGENEITPYLVSRFYRAPEIILGLPYDHALDIWSVGCCLYELYTGKMLFPGHTNNDMLRLHMELKGPFPKKMLKKAAFVDQHFDQDFNFCAIEEDPVTKKAIKRILVNVKPRDMGILVTGSGTVDEDSKMLASFKDLLEKIFVLDPDKRLTVSQALSHSFISGK